MKKFFNCLIVVSALILALFLLASCKTSKEEPAPTGSSQASDTQNSEKTTDIVSRGKTAYTIVYKNSSHTVNAGTDQDVKIAVNTTDKFLAYDMARAFDCFVGVEPELVKDTTAAGEFEIIIGEASRDGVRTGIASDEYGYELADKKIYIWGGSAEAKYFALNHFVASYLTSAEEGELSLVGDVEYSAKLPGGLSRTNWQLLVPAYDGGTLQKDVYDLGSGRTDDVSKKGTIEDSFMHIIGDTSAAEFDAYIAKLKSVGYTADMERTAENNKYARFIWGGSSVYAYYTDSTKTVRVIEDRTSNTTVSEIADEHSGKGDVELYQYSLDYTANGYTGKDAINCGMFYIIKLPDNSLVLIDGGHDRQVQPDALDAMINFLYNITGLDKSETLNIAAWHFTHGDGDHVNMFTALTERLGADKLEIDCFMFNFPSAIYIAGTDAAKAMRSTLSKYYPDARYIKQFTGMTFDFGEMQWETLYTHEAAYDTDGALNVSDANDASTNTFIHFDNHKTWLMADINTLGQRALCKMYSTAYLKCDVVLASHHGHNLCANMYSAAAADYCFVSQSKENALTYGGYPSYSAMAKNIYYAGKYTYVFKIVDGRIAVYQIDRAYPPRYEN